ncbi:MAG: sterol desaturase family protein [Alphaproteobacteria bacterium]|nr:sterol desaturase family protein [Alphaproteobacteria bacterium]
MVSFLEGLALQWVDEFARYFLIAGAVFVLLRLVLAPLKRHRNVQPKKADRKRIWREVLYSARTCLVFAVIALGIDAGVEAGILKIHTEEGRWLETAGATLLMIVAHDAYFYWAHRLMHHPRLFRLFHITHHKSHAPTPWTAYSFDWAEALVMASFLPLFTALVPIHAAGAIFWAFHQLIRNALGHSGVEIMPRWLAASPRWGWMTSVMHHDMHHRHYNANFGLYFTWWDRLMGTEHPDYRAEYDRVTLRAKRNEVPARA